MTGKGDSMAKKPKQDILPSDFRDRIAGWVVLFAIFVLCCSICGFVIGFEYIGAEFGILFWVIMGILLFCGLNSLITEEKIIRRVFFIPYRTILWEDVIQIGIMRTRGYRSSGTFITLTLKGCPKFEQGKDNAGGYLRKHSRKTITIGSSERKYLKADVKLIEKYYGILDYGYDKLVD